MDFDLSEDWAPEGSLLRRSLDVARTQSVGVGSRLPEGDWAVDGRPGARTTPTDRAAIVQRLDGDQVIEGWYVLPSEIPDALIAVPPAGPASPQTEAEETVYDEEFEAPLGPGRHRSRVMIGLAGASALGTGLTLALASSIYDRHIDDPDRATYEAAADVNHAAIIAGGALGVTSATLALSAILTWEW